MKLILTTIFFLLALQFSAFSQDFNKKDIKKNSCSCENEENLRNYFEQFEKEQKFIEQCLIETDENHKKLNLPKPRRISNIGSIVISLVKPHYPPLAKQLQISGEILIEIFTDEKGNVVFAKVLKGNVFFAENAKKAACKSKFTPQIYCEKFVKTRHIIKYNFILN